MKISEKFIAEINEEAEPTRRMLERIPPEKFDWKPHEKSMTLQQLSTLVAQMFYWFGMMAEKDVLDFADGWEQPQVTSAADLVKLLDDSVAASVKVLSDTDDAEYDRIWTMRHGERVFMEIAKGDVIRQSFRHLAHHRGQLSVYMRLLEIPVPSIYGPTADENTFM